MRAVFLDRDGVLNEALVRDGKPYPPASLSETRMVPDAASALKRLKARGFLLIVVTNQPDVARGTAKREQVEEIHRFLQSELPIDHFRTCYHDNEDDCSCRKPKPGLLLEAAHECRVDLKQSFMIGDRWRDIDAGHAAGCRTILVDYGYAERGPSEPPSQKVHSLGEAVDWILAGEAQHP